MACYARSGALLPMVNKLKEVFHMKKLISIAMLMVVMASFAACGGSSGAADPNGTENPPSGDQPGDQPGGSSRLPLKGPTDVSPWRNWVPKSSFR